jgi:hypothetical protein
LHRWFMPSPPLPAATAPKPISWRRVLNAEITALFSAFTFSISGYIARG